MMNTLEKHFLVHELQQLAAAGDLPPHLARQAQHPAWTDYHELAESWQQALNPDRPGLGELYLLLHIFLRDDAGVRRGLALLLDGRDEADPWGGYFRFIGTAAGRLVRRDTLEAFENALDDIDWSALNRELLYKCSWLIGYVYLHEDKPEWRLKGRFWLEKAQSEADPAVASLPAAFLVGYYLEGAADEAERRLTALSPTLRAPHVEAELQVRLAFARQRQAQLAEDKFAQAQAALDRAQKTLPTLHGDDVAVRRCFQLYVAEACVRLADLSTGDEERLNYYEQALDALDEAMASSDRTGVKLLTAEPLERNGRIQTLKKNWREASRLLRDALNLYKKYELNIDMARAYTALADIQFRTGKPLKGHEFVLEALRHALKRLDEGGVHILLYMFAYANDVLLAELPRPGVSWMVQELDKFFAYLVQFHELCPEHADHIGLEAFEDYKIQYLRLEPAAHAHIKVYFLYQYHAIRVLELSALLRGDEQARRVAAALLREINHPNAPHHFLTADWKEFREVPNQVRNKVVNKCISISKGDLPLAAQHLDFSYRNLRSYITYKEVNRLGFFLDEADTNSRALEAGIRLMLHDLYESGKIFEVVFDVPRFLVQYATTGFHAGQMEEDLDIKYNTAKKYLKIMTDIGLVTLDKTGGKKNHYAIAKDSIMARYLQQKEKDGR